MNSTRHSLIRSQLGLNLLMAFTLTGCFRLNTRPPAEALQATAPEFSLPDANGRIVSLSSLLERRPVVIVFSRGAWCPFCRSHLKALSKDIQKFDSAGVTLVSLSSDTPEAARKLSDEQNLQFALLSDVSGETIAKYGVLADGDRETPVAVQAVFAVDRERRIVWSKVGQFPWSTESADDLLAAIRKQ